MGIGRRNDDIRAAVAQTQRDHDAVAEAVTVVELFNSRLARNKTTSSWPTIEAALVSKHHWLVFACDSCHTIIDLDLRVKRRKSTAPIQIAHDDVRCPRCNGHGKTRIEKLARFPSI
jgi:ribosomal protein L44E